MGGRAGGKGGRTRAQCWGIEELVAKTGDLVCDLPAVPNSFNASHRFIKMTLRFTRTWHTKCSYSKAQHREEVKSEMANRQVET